MTRFSILTAGISLLYSALLTAQPLQKPQRILIAKDGLPQSFVSGLVQDEKGFVWVGTRNGLALYDGIHFRLFRNIEGDSSTLSSNVIISLGLDRHGRIWVEHESVNLDVLDPVSETIERITQRPLFRSRPVLFVRRGWLGDARGDLWCIEKAKGLYRYDWQHSAVDHYTRQLSGFPSDTLRGLLEDRKGRIWVLSQRGISVRDTGTRHFRHIPIPFTLDFNNYVNADAEIVALHERSNGEIMLGDRKRLIFFDPVRSSFRTVTLPGNPENGIRRIQTGPDGREYLESEGIVYRYDDREGLIAVGDIGRPEPELRIIESFLVDRSGLIWLGTNAAGIQQIDLGMPFFESHPTRWSFHQDLFRQEFGISVDRFAGWPLSDKRYRLSSYYARSTYDARGRLWFGLRNRAGYYDSAERKMVSLPEAPDISDPANPVLGIRGLAFDPDGRLWIVSDKGYIGYFDSGHRRWTTVFTAADLVQRVGITLNPVDLLADRDRLWISTGGQGLLCIDIPTRRVRRFTRSTNPEILPSDLLEGLQRDPVRPDQLWIGTYEGLVCLNKNTLKAQVFSVTQGLPDNTIYSILTDKAGYLWLSTNKGLCRFHPLTHQVLVYQSGDGLPGDEFNRFHHLRLPDGRLAFGGTEGWTLFDPLRIKADNYRPPVVFTGLKINDMAVSPMAGGLLPVPLNECRILSLPYDQNTLTFEFAGLEFGSPQKLRYRYQLEGYNNDWIGTGNTPVATYTKLPPGHYTFRIDATNTSGQWSPYVRSLSLVIRPPLWRTWWAYTLYALFAIAAFWQYIRYRVRRERQKQEILLKQREADQLKALDEVKSRFFSNITHELRTPLTLILTPAQRLEQVLEKEDQRHWLATIERNTHRLLRLINQLLDLSKLEAGALRIHETAGSVRQFLEELIRSFREDAESKDIRLVFIDQADPAFYWFDADRLEQIAGNLIANALTHTPAKGQVELVLYSGTSRGLCLVVRDSGAGIPPERLPFIFDRFYQAANRSTSGSGIGLSLVKELVEWQGGTIKAESPGAAPWKTVFTVWLPYRKAALADPVSAEPTDQALPQEDQALSSNQILSSSQILSSNQILSPDPALSRDNALSQEQPDRLSESSEEEEYPSILLVEDNAELAGFIADSLPTAYRVSHAADGAEGLEKALELLPDLVISDVLMPVMDGYTLCRRLKADERTNHIPVILLTAKAAFDDRMTGLAGGADDYLTKPFHIQELQLRAANLLKRQHLLREKLRRQLSLPSDGAAVRDALAETTVLAETTELPPAFLQKLYAIVEEHLDETSFSVEDLSRHIGMSRANLHRKVKVLTGLTTRDIIRNYRLKRAAFYLKEGYNSSETAYKVGFSSPAYFSQCFREFYQTTPLEFARQSG